MERSRKLVLTDWTQANNALNTYFEGNKSKLAEHVKMSRTTVTNFFGEKPVRESEFRKICFALRLNWESVSSVEASNDRPSTQPESQDDLFQQVKERCRQKILTQHSRMRLLSGEEIGVDQLYVDVWLLNRSPRTFQVSESKLLEPIRKPESLLLQCMHKLDESSRDSFLYISPIELTIAEIDSSRSVSVLLPIVLLCSWECHE